MGRIIAVASGKGGVGKTTLVANLGIALAKAGKKVIMVDADLDMANLELVLGMEGRPITLQDVLNGEAHTQDAVYDVIENAKFVPAGISPSQFRRVDPEKLQRTVLEYSGNADFVLLDCPAGVGRDTIACFAACKETILVVVPEPISATDAYKTRIVAEKMGSEILGAVMNMIRGIKGELTEREVQTLLECPILAKINDDPLVRECVVAGKPIVRQYPTTQTSQIIRRLASELAGVAFKVEAPKQSIVSRLFGFLKRKR